MPERARAVVLASNGTGDVIPNATVTVRNPGTTTNISETIYVNDDPDTSQYTNGAFFTSATGLVTFYLTNQKRVDVLFSKSGWTSVTIPVDVQKSSLVSGESVATSTIWDAAGDLAKGTGADTAARLARGTANQVLRTNAGATDIEWGVEQARDIVTTAGDITYATAADTLARLGIGTAGQVLKVNSGATAPEWGAASASSFVGARVYRTANQTIANNTWTAVEFDNETFDSDGFHDNVTNNTRITIPAGKGGKYRVRAHVTWDTVSGKVEIAVKKNSGFVAHRTADAPGVYATNELTDEFVLIATDYLEVFVRQSTGASVLLTASGLGDMAAFFVEFLGA